jgi:hypothetical protein
MTVMTETRLLEIIAAHGADPGRWPEDEREDALGMLGQSAAGANAIEEASILDTMLGKNPAPPASMALRARVASIPGQHGAGASALARLFWPFGAIWQPAIGLAAAAIIGIVVGIGSPPEDISLSQIESETYVTVIAAAGGEIEESLQ